MYIIADITKTHSGTEASIINRISNFQSSENTIDVVAYQRQISALPATLINNCTTTEVQENLDVGNLIFEKIQTLLKDEHIKRLVVLSFNGYVLSLTNKISPSDVSRVTFLTWGQAWKIGQTVSHTNTSLATWPLGHITKEEATEALRIALRNKNALSEESSIRKTDIRHYVESVEPRLEKSHTSQINGFISKLLDLAQQENIISINKVEENHKIWLTPHATELKKTNNDASKKNSNTSFVELLKQGGMGPFSNFRDELYDAINELVTSSCKPTLQELINKSVAKVQQANSDGHNGFQWGAVKSFLKSLLTLKPVALCENNHPLRPNFVTMSTKVHSLAEDWRHQLDGELMLYLLRQNCEISFHDLPNLTGALYKTRDEPYDTRINEVITYLKTNNKITFDEGASLLKLVVEAAPV